jgi:hypothetical protein
MSQWSPCKRVDFIRRLRRIGFNGPYSGPKHEFLVFDNHRMTIPTNSEFTVPQSRMMLREAGEILGRNIILVEWNNLK